jgi:hypothetical protein
VKQHPDPSKRDKATFIARFRQAIRLYKLQEQSAKPTISPERAAELVSAGQQMRQPVRPEDRARQAVNSGPTAGTLNGNPVRDTKSRSPLGYVRESLKSAGELELRDLI